MISRRNFLASAAAAPVLLASHVDALQGSTPDVTTEMNVTYGEVNGTELLLDVYRPPARDTPRPAVILLYGNSWTAGYASRSQLNSAASDLAAHGYVAFNVDFRLLTYKEGENIWPAQLDDVQRAVRWIRANAATYGVDPERVASYGLSSGGQLAAMLGVRETRDNSVEALARYSSRVNCAVSVVGAYDLSVPSSNADDNRVVRNLLGGTIDEVPAAYRDASPIEWVDGDSAPFLIVHSGDDPEDSPEAPRAMAAALQRAVVDVAYIEYQQTNHMSWTNWSLPAPWTLTFLQVQLRPEE